MAAAGCMAASAPVRGPPKAALAAPPPAAPTAPFAPRPSPCAAKPPPVAAAPAPFSPSSRGVSPLGMGCCRASPQAPAPDGRAGPPRYRPPLGMRSFRLHRAGPHLPVPLHPLWALLGVQRRFNPPPPLDMGCFHPTRPPRRTHAAARARSSAPSVPPPPSALESPCRRPSPLGMGCFSRTPLGACRPAGAFDVWDSVWLIWPPAPPDIRRK
jgi:hypothetical protein